MNLNRSQQLLKFSKKEKNVITRIRLLAVSRFLKCQNRTQNANQLMVSRRSANNWLSNYLSFGLSGHTAGCPSKTILKRRNFLLISRKQELLAKADY
jgi:hypothetical protein